MNSPDTGASPQSSAFARIWSAYPLHPPLTHVTVGAYTTAVLLGTVGVSGVAEPVLAKGWWLALLVGFGASVVTALTGVVDFIVIGRRNPARRATLAHMILMLAGMPFFGAAVLVGRAGYVAGEIQTLPVILNLAAFALLVVGASLGGKLVYEHGLRVKPAMRAHAGDGDRHGV